MLRCPFCETDVDDAELRAGRCPTCGSMLAWSDVEETETSRADIYVTEDPATELAESAARDDVAKEAALASTIDMPAESEAPVSDSATNPDDSQVPAERGTATDELISETIQPRHLTDGESQALGNLWKRTISPGTRTNATLRTDSGRPRTGIGTSMGINVPSRQVQRPHEPRENFADYQLIEMIGEGGAGLVYAARQTSIDRTVALKMLRPDARDQYEERQKFLSEAVVTGDLDHPNIVPIHDLGVQDDGALFYSMKRVVGTPWSDVLARKSLVENLEILIRVADAVAFAHARGIVHRDLKPENVMLGDFGEVLLMDWGIALATPEFAKNRSITETSSLGGTPAYMAPEMATGPVEIIGPHSDVYLLGGILYEVITHLTPHTGEDVMDCLHAAAENRIQPTKKQGELLDIALRAMSTEPSERFASVRIFEDAIRDYQSHTESLALTVRAEEDLAQAADSNDYRDFARSLFAFEEAFALWNGNQLAREGISKARLAYAEAARSKGDYDLGASLLDADKPSHRALLTKLQAAQQARDVRQHRLKTVKRVAGSLVVVLFAVIAVAGYFIWQAKEEAVDAKDTALIAQRTAMTAQGLAKSEAAVAIKARKNLAIQKKRAVRLKDLANDETRIARQAEAAAKAARNREEIAKLQTQYEAYISQIALAAKEIDNNSFDEGRRLLREYENSELRHWEWARLWYLCQRSRTDFECPKPVDAVAFSPDGSRFITGSQDGIALVWKTSLDQKRVTEPLFRLVHAAGQAIWSVAWSPDGKYLATAGADSLIRIWKAGGASKDPLMTLKGHRASVQSAVFSFSGKHQWLVSGSRDNSVIIWDIPTGKVAKKLLGHSWWVWDVAVSPTQNQIVSAGQDGKIIVWSVNSSGDTFKVDPVGAPDSGTRTKVLVDFHKGPVYSVAFSPDGRRIVSGGFDNRVIVWNPEEAQSIDLEKRIRKVQQGQPPFVRLQGHTAPVWSVSFSPDGHGGQLVLSSADDNTIKVWDSRTGKLVQTLRGHGGWVRSSTFAPDKPKQFVTDVSSPADRVVLSGSHDGRAKLWRIAGYDEVRVIRSHFLDGNEDAVLGVAIDHTGRQIATAGRDRIARIHQLKTGREIVLKDRVQEYGEGHDYLATDVLYLKSGKYAGRRFLTAGMDNTVRLWDAVTGSEVARLPETGRHAAIALSPDGKWLATGFSRNADSAVPADKDDQPVVALLWRIDGLKAAETPVPAKVVFGSVDPRSGNRRATVTALAFSPDNRTLLLGDAAGKCSLWNVAGGGRMRTLGDAPGEFGHTARIFACAFLGNGRRAVTASGDNTAIVWNVATRRVLAQLTHPDAVSALELSPDGRRLLTISRTRSSGVAGASGTAALMRVWEVEPTIRRDKFQSFEFSRMAITSARFSPDGKRVLTVAHERGGKTATADDAILSEWDIDNRRRTPLWPKNTRRRSVWSAAYSPDGKRVLTVGGRYAKLWDRAGGRRLMLFGPHVSVTKVSFSRDGDMLATVEDGESVKIWNVQTRRVLQRLVGVHRGSIGTAVFSPVDNNRLMTAGTTVKFWRFNPQNSRWEQTGPTLNGRAPKAAAARVPAIRDAAFSPDGKLVATASDDGTVRVWNAETGKLVGRLAGRHGHAGIVLCVQFSPDGRWIISGGKDKTAIIWERDASRRSWTAIARMTGHPAPVNSVAVSHDRHRALTGSDDKTAKLWDTRRLTNRGVIRPGAQRSLSVQQILDNFDDLKKILDQTGDASFQSEILTASRDLSALPPLKAKWPNPPKTIADVHQLIRDIRSTLKADKTIAEDDLQQIARAVSGFRRLVAGPESIREIFTLRGHTREVTGVVFAPDGRYVVTGSRDGTAVLWPAVNIAPVVHVSEDDLIVTPDTLTVSVAPNAIVRDSDARNLAGNAMTIELTNGRLKTPGRLTIADTRRIRRAKSAIYFRPNAKAESVAIAEVLRDADGTKFTITFNKHANASAASALLRAVRFDGSGMSGSKARSQILVKLTDSYGETSQPKSRVVRFQTPGKPSAMK